MAPVSRETARATQPGDVTPSITDPTRDATEDQAVTTEAGPTGSGTKTTSGYHDARSGRPLTEKGEFVDEPGHSVDDQSRIVADNWPALQDQADADAAKDRDRLAK